MNCFEMVIDPIANLWAERKRRTELNMPMKCATRFEEDTFKVDGNRDVKFSCIRSWFEPFKHPPGTKFDHLGKLKKPFKQDQGRLRDYQEKTAG